MQPEIIFFMQLGQGICLMFLNTKGGDVMTDPIIWQWKKMQWTENIWSSKNFSNIHNWNLTQISYFKKKKKAAAFKPVLSFPRAVFLSFGEEGDIDDKE